MFTYLLYLNVPGTGRYYPGTYMYCTSKSKGCPTNHNPQLSLQGESNEIYDLSFLKIKQLLQVQLEKPKIDLDFFRIYTEIFEFEMPASAKGLKFSKTPSPVYAYYRGVQVSGPICKYLQLNAGDAVYAAAGAKLRENKCSLPAHGTLGHQIYICQFHQLGTDITTLTQHQQSFDCTKNLHFHIL